MYIYPQLHSGPCDNMLVWPLPCTIEVKAIYAHDAHRRRPGRGPRSVSTPSPDCLARPADGGSKPRFDMCVDWPTEWKIGRLENSNIVGVCMSLKDSH